MNAESARQLIPLYRPGKQMDPRVIKAVRFAESDAVLRDEIEWQMHFDDEVVGVINCIKPPENLRQKLEELGQTGASAKGAVRANVFNPAIISALFGVLLLAGFLVYLKMESEKDFPGKKWVVNLVQINDRMTGAELEPTKLPAGELVDNMMLRGFERFALPPELSPLPAVGWRVFRHSGNKVAQVAIDRNSLIVYVFRASDFGVQPGPEKTWKVFAHERWAAAATVRDGLCTVVSFRGDQAEMETLLKTLKP